MMLYSFQMTTASALDEKHHSHMSPMKNATANSQQIVHYDW